ncbi:hypothetical protein [Cellvibrio sp. OA-2007]|uniref:hypothetical protein n=1 Tax=Cellvibrio sp. OA-2007 TaxID=529823 RepID=UPI0007854EAA|nr:hypothetical protein [Cellvibrio sp. OA-2007]
MKILRCVFVAIFFVTPSVMADQFCFALAATYYEQVYCQLQAKAQTKGLPPFNQFKKNNEIVQASLLKRPAERNGIKLPAPTRKTQTPMLTPALIMPAPVSPVVKNPQLSVTETVRREPLAELTRKELDGVKHSAECNLAGNQIRCGNYLFKLVGNRANHRLASGSLSPDNKMNLPGYQGGALSQYLTQAYDQYIAKMCEIGLCGVTMTYGKFAYLYQDLQAKGLDFPQRFEIMYGFLKKDKANMGVSESSSVLQGISLQNCAMLTAQRYVCDYQGRNYIFELQ